MPALALAEAVPALRPEIEPVLVGSRRGIESQLLPRYPFRYHLLPLEPIYRRAWWRNLRWPVTAWRLLRAINALLAREAPAVVIGTGGYVAGPVVWRAQRAGIPTAIQEQNAFPGLATRWLARSARQVHLGFPEARARLRVGPGAAVYALGNPIRTPAPGDPAHARAGFGLAPDRPTLLVFGGSQGALALNRATAAALERGLLGDINLLWGSGPTHATLYAPYATPGRVVVRGFFDPVAQAYQAADLVLCRAGAMTVAELCAWGKPSVLVPLPTAAADHQTENARALAAAGAAILLPERDLTPETLAHTVGELVRSPDRLDSMARAARARGNPNAAREVMSRILTLIQ